MTGPRRPGRPRVEAHRRAIMDAAAALLADQPLQTLRVAEIIERAGVARGTFYSHFASKNAVAAALLEDVMGEILTAIQPFVGATHPDAPREALRVTVQAGARAWSANAVVLRMAAQNWHAVPELSAAWLGFLDQFSAAIAAEIERQRDAGLAPPGLQARALSATLVQATVHCLYLSGLARVDGLPDEAGIAEAILALWFGAIYRERP